MILGSTLLVRSGATSSELDNEVHRLWGPPMSQRPPLAAYKEIRRKREVTTIRDPQGRPLETEVERDEEVEHGIPLDATTIATRLSLTHRQKGLLWFATYGVEFDGTFTFANPAGPARHAEVRFPLGGGGTIYDEFHVYEATGAQVAAVIADGVAHWTVDLTGAERRTYQVTYRSRGTSSWEYVPTEGTGQVKNFKLTMDTDFADVDFPSGTLSPQSHAASGGRWHGEWKFGSLVANAPVGVTLPQKLNPGPLASRITFFAPLSLLFYFFVVAVLATAQRRQTHPINYFFFGCAFFAFHLLFAYLVDKLAIVPSFAIASAVSIFLCTSYARLFMGWRFALREMGVSQLVYLVLFSFTFFVPGFTGLAITIGAILTLFMMMQVTGRTRWDQVAGGPADRAPEVSLPAAAQPR
jgi:hypothetical protein